MTSLKQLLLEEINNKGKVTRAELRAFGRTAKTTRNQHGFDSASVDRDLRHLTNDKQIAPLTEKGYIIAYLPVLELKSLRRAIPSPTSNTQQGLGFNLPRIY